MRWLILSLFASVTWFSSSQINVDSIGYLDIATLHNQNLNDVWGYEDELGNEYVIAGGTKGTSVVDISDPSNPVEIFFEPGDESVWRDIKTFGDYAYVTTEGSDGLLIIDLTPLPASTSLTATHYYGPIVNQWQSAHNLFIDANGFCYIFGPNRGNGGVIILNLNLDPLNPVEVGTYDTWYTHDGMVQNDTLYAGHILDGFFSMVDVSDKANPAVLGIKNTPTYFAHNIWADNSQYVYTTDEISGGYIGSFDVSDASNIIELDRIQSSPGKGVIPHNAHVVNNYLVTSYYSDGVVVHDITYPHNIIEIGQFDTFDGTTQNYEGCWGVYPFFSSGLMAATDIQNGLYILNPNYTQACYLEGLVRNQSTLSPVADVEVTISSDNQVEATKTDGTYATGILSSGTYDVTYFKPGYYPQTISVNLSTGNVVIQDVDLVPIPQYTLDITVLDASNNSPIDNAEILLEAVLIDHNGVSNAIGEEAFSLYYQEKYRVSCGKWGYRSYCDSVFIDNSTGTMTIHLEPGYYDDFNFDFGWSVISDAERGWWERGEPISTGANPGEDGTDCGDQCYVTGNGLHPTPHFDDLFNGTTILKSPLLDLTTMTEPYLLFDYWFFCFYGPNQPDDTLRVFASNGIDKIEVFKQGSDPAIFEEWVSTSIKLSDFVSMTSTMQFEFVVHDSVPNDNVTEAGLDAFQVIEQASLGIEKISSNNLIVYPNPSSGQINILGEVGYAFILDFRGAIIKEAMIDEKNYSIDLSQLSPGIYFLRINNQLRKIVLE